MSDPLRIIVADGEPEMRDYVEDTPTVPGHRSIAAVENGRRLVEACREHRPDLIVTDIQMPGTDGLEASAELRNDVHVPVILVSGCHDPELVGRAFRPAVVTRNIEIR